MKNVVIGYWLLKLIETNRYLFKLIVIYILSHFYIYKLLSANLRLKPYDYRLTTNH
jgi:hypothetical protein